MGELYSITDDDHNEMSVTSRRERGAEFCIWNGRSNNYEAIALSPGAQLELIRALVDNLGEAVTPTLFDLLLDGAEPATTAASEPGS